MSRPTIRKKGKTYYLIVVRSVDGNMDVRTYYDAKVSQAVGAHEMGAVLKVVHAQEGTAVGYLVNRRLTAQEIEQQLSTTGSLKDHPSCTGGILAAADPTDAPEG